MANDLRFALRTLRRAPGFAAIAILFLALGIGAHTAIVSLLYQVALREVPVRDPHSLVELESDSFNIGWTRRDNNGGIFSYPMYRELSDRNQSFSGVMARSSFASTLAFAFGPLAGILAAAGLYGVVSYAVEWRTREFGIRLVLGAVPATVLALVTRAVAALVGVGLAVGLPGRIEPVQAIRHE
jgi:hypothetical protein